MYDEFVEKSVERAKKRVVGDPFEVLVLEHRGFVYSALGYGSWFKS